MNWICWCRGLSSSIECKGGNCYKESCQNKDNSPFRISQKACFCIRGRLHQVAFHILDPWIESFSLIRRSSLVIGTYLSLQSLSHNFEGCLSQRHQRMSPIMWLIFLGSLRPSAPFDFGRHILSQPTRAHFLSGSWPCQRKVCWRFLMDFITDYGVSRVVKR